MAPNPVDLDFCLILRIGKGKKKTYYQVKILIPDRSIAVRAWRLTKPNGTSYDVMMNERHGMSCTCADFIWKRQNSPEPCKHCIAITEVGLNRRSQ